MSKKRKTILMIIGGAVLVPFLVNVIFNAPYRSHIPTLPDLQSLTPVIQEQLTTSSRKAYRNPTSNNLGELGMAYHSCANYEKAAECYKLAIKKNKSEWIWNYYLGFLNREMGDSKSSIENFNAVIKEDPTITQVWFYLGKAYQNLGLGEKAEEAYKKIANLKNENSNTKAIRVNYSSFPVSAKFELARIYLNTKRLDEAEKILKEVIAGNHTIGPVFRLLGNVYSAKGDSVLSKKYLVRAQDLAEVTTLNDTITDRITLISRSELYLPKQIDDAKRSGNPEWARKLFNNALLYLSDDKYIISKAIKFFVQMNDGTKALPYLNKNFKDFKDDFKEMNYVADMLFTKGFYSQAIRYYSQAIKLKPESTDLYENFALSYWKDSKKDSALTLMSELYEKNKNNPKVLESEVDFMIKAGEKDKAKFYLTKYSQLAPSDPKFLKQSGIMSEMEGNQNAAITMYEAAFKGDPADLETTQKLGEFYIKQRLWNKSIDLFRSAIKYHPNESYLIIKLGTVLFFCPDPKLRSTEEGLEFSERAFFHITSSINTILSAGKNLAYGNALQGDFKTATYYMNTTIGIARSEKMPMDYMDGLLKLKSEIKRLIDK